MCNLKKKKSKALFLNIAGLATFVLFVCLSLACEQAREPALDVGATVDAAVAATLQAQRVVPPSAPTPTIDASLATTLASAAATFEAQSTVPPSAPTPTVDASLATTLASAAATFEAQSAVPSSAPTPTIDASLAATLASAAATFEAQSAVPSSAPTPTNVGQTISAPMPTTVAVPTHTLTPRPTPTTVPTPTLLDIKMANCRQEDTGGYEFVMSEGPDSYEQWGVREWYRTTWSGDYPKAERIRCRTSVYDSIEDARWSLIYSTALQRGEWSQAGLLEHRQIIGVNIGEDSLVFEIETGRGSLPEYVSSNILIRRGIVVIHLEAISNIGRVNPMFRGNARDAFFGSVWSPLIEIAHHADGRLLAELDRVSR